MTIIAAIATDDRVIMGCDTATNYCGTAVYSATGKIRQLHTTGPAEGEVILIGCSGNSGIGPTVQRAVQIHDVPDGTDPSAADNWAGTVSEAIAAALADAVPPLTVPADGHNAAYSDGTMLLAWRQYVWTITTHSAIRPASGIIAIGSGTDFALGAMVTAELLQFSDPVKNVEMAIKLTCRYIDGCDIDGRGPIIRETLPAAAT